ncbi:hypothetical protein A3E42_01210 [Candidatus Gottesmanbacteria bacterium RIFCSPHIGHO2_12_FULL_40_13]|nr:MAG: hypothetical protein A3E42_01210 [Candidatus Gottesmanbacteria bacterium RIFCSPHIGHO2_12_FULL_40_13]
MPRAPRLLLSKSFYHIITRGNNKNKTFKAAADYLAYLNLFRKYKVDHPFDLYHYCLMPNHTHFLIQTHSSDNFSSFMKKLNLSYFYYYKRKYDWIGHFWQDRFKSQPVGKDDYFLQCGKYIELNPIRANLVKRVEDYPFSSYRYYVLGEDNDLISEDFTFQTLSRDLEKRRQIYREMIIGEIVSNTYKKKVWGSKKQRYNEAKKISYHIS